MNNKSLKIALFLIISLSACSCEERYNTTQAWTYGIISSICISFTALIASLGIALLLKYKNKKVKIFVSILVLFGAGALIGDVFIHLIPHTFEKHQDTHAEEEDADHDAQNTTARILFLKHSAKTRRFFEEQPNSVTLQNPLHDDHDEDHADEEHHDEHAEDSFAGHTNLIVFFIFVGFLTFEMGEKYLESNHITHSHDYKDEKDEEVGKSEEKVYNDPEYNNNASPQVQPLENNQTEQNQNLVNNLEIDNNIDKQPENSENNLNARHKQKKSSWKGKKSQGWMQLIADFIHNIMDGIAIGVAFISKSKATAVSTVIAVVAHEIPMDLGIMGILLDSKFFTWQAILCNSIKEISKLIGCLIGLGVGSVSLQGQNYLIGFVIGNFLYISLIDMYSNIKSEKRFKIYLLKLLGFVCGIGVMFLVTLAETSHEDH